MSGARQLFAVVVALAAVSPALGQAPSAARAQYLAGTCTNCHGPQGRSAGTMPGLAGMQAPILVEQMTQFREGKRPATIMHQIAKGYTVLETEALADYFARQSPSNGGNAR